MGLRTLTKALHLCPKKTQAETCTIRPRMIPEAVAVATP